MGVPAGALAGEYVGVSAEIGLGLGAGANVLLGGSDRTIALQPLSLQGVDRDQRDRGRVIAQPALVLGTDRPAQLRFKVIEALTT